MTSKERFNLLQKQIVYKSKEYQQNCEFHNLQTNETIDCKALIELIQTDLEVLEIIKTKNVFPLALMSMPYELYNDSVLEEQQLTQEEYDKVKGWLKNE